MPEKTDFPVGISKASRMLGVSEPALRQWTDEGTIKSFLTPGGHRRYSPSELKRFMSLRNQTTGIKDLAIKLEDSINLHREIAIHFLESIEWYSKLDKESQKQFSGLGRAMLQLITRAISNPAKREYTFNEIRELGRKFGEMTQALGLPLIDALQAFIRHRDPIVNLAADFMKKSETFNRRILAALPLINYVLDEALLALVAIYQEKKG